MLFKTVDISVLKTEPKKRSGPSNAEREAAQQFERLRSVTTYLREHGHGGCIILPLPLNMLNAKEARHWSETGKLKQQYLEYCTLIYNSKLLPPMPDERPHHVTAQVQFYVINRFDSDNLNALMKFPWDWMKGRYITDDADKHLTVTMLPQIVDRRCPRVVIRLMPTE